MRFWAIILGLITIYGLLAYKEPFTTKSLVPNLEPGPDVFYYSMPAWNLTHGNGFRMMAFGVEKEIVVKPLYGWLLIPFFKFFNDFRSFYFLNIGLGIISIIFFGLTIRKLFIKNYEVILMFLGLILVTNFYFYNLPSLLMSENLVVPLVLIAGWLMVTKSSWINFGLLGLIVVLLWLAKSSNVPVIGVTLVFADIKFWRWQYLDQRRKIWLLGVVCLLGSICAVVVLKGKTGEIITDGTWFSIRYFGGNLKLFLHQFVGGEIRYLWYINKLIENWIGWMSILGLGIGLMVRRHRFGVSFILAVIVVNVVFFSFFYSKEGRYMSTVVPIFLFGIGYLLEQINNKWMLVVVGCMVVFYLGQRITINGFTERRATTLKRQIMNNFRENEIPWNYVAIQEFNKFFSKKDTDCYFGSILNAYFFQLLSNNNCHYLPITNSADFNLTKEQLKNLEKSNEELRQKYINLVNEGKKVYVSPYYGSASVLWENDYQKLVNNFNLTEVDDGCQGSCKIYKLGEKIKVKSQK
jgi:hypothetical protein